MKLDPGLRSRWIRNLGSVGIALLLWLLINFAHAAEGENRLLGLLYDFEDSLVDLRFDWRGTRTPDDQIVLVTIDAKSVEAKGRWPWTRREMAALVETLGNAGAKVVAFDILFSEPELADDDPDGALATAIQNGPAVVLPYRWLDTGELHEISTGPPGISAPWFQQLESKGSLGGAATYPMNCPSTLPLGSTPLVDRLVEASSGLGFANYPQDRHGKARKAWLVQFYSRASFELFRAGDLHATHEDLETMARNPGLIPKLHPCRQIDDPLQIASLPTTAVGLYLGLAPGRLLLEGPDGGLGPTTSGQVAPPTPSEAAEGNEPDLPRPFGQQLDPYDHTIWIDYYGPRQTFLTHSYLDVMECPGGRCLKDRQKEPMDLVDAFAGKLVFVGVTDPGAHDSFPTPTDSDLAGLEMQATVAQNLLEGRQLRYAHDEAGQTAIVSLIAALLVALTIANLGTLPATAILVFAATVFTRWTFHRFVEEASVWNWAIPLLTVTTTHALVTIFCALHENRHRRRQHSAFIRYLSKPAVDAILADPSGVHFGRQEHDATVLFLDLADFESLAGQVRDRRQLIGPLNSYLSRVIRVLLDTADDTVIKIFGHGVMAVFVCPDHAPKACRAALRVPETLSELQVELEAWGLQSEGLACRIGMTSGEVVVGNVGSQRLVDYTVIGETVEGASRLQRRSMAAGREILVDPTTRRLIPNDDEGLIFRPFSSDDSEDTESTPFELVRRPTRRREARKPGGWLEQILSRRG